MSCNKGVLWFAVLAVFIFYTNSVSSAMFKFTNVKCEDIDPTYLHFRECKLSVVRRGTVALNIHADLLKSPVTNASMNIALYKRGNGYNPYLFNKSADACAYFAERKKYPVLDVIFSMFIKNSNLNHTCPYYDNFFIKDLVLQERTFALLPLPNGQYLFKSNLYAFKKLRGIVQVFFARTE